MFKSYQSRREFIKFMGRSGTVLSLPLVLNLAACTSKRSKLAFTPIEPNLTDKLVLADGFKYQILISAGDSLNESGQSFGYNNDYIDFIQQSEREALLWVNHESVNPLFNSGFNYRTDKNKSKKQVDQEMELVGGSILKLVKKDGAWQVDVGSKLNRRLTAKTPIPFAGGIAIEGKKTAMGTLANCAGGKTPWGHFLTCEENYDYFYGENEYQSGKKQHKKSRYGWEKYYPNPPEHYGWVVEVNPLTGDAKKLTALGRFAHESATVVQAKDGRCVVYSGDDRYNQCLYKFVAEKKGSFESGELFAADITNGKWLSLDINKSEVLKKKYKNQLDVLIHARQAALDIGATELDRPEDVEVDPVSGHVFVALTNNKMNGNAFGSILKIKESENDYLASRFSSETFINGGPINGLSCPDNMAFDKKGNLWMANDISGSLIGKAPYESFGNNGLYYIPTSGPQAGKVLQVASAPADAEFTGPCFSEDGKTLFLSVQHPGETSPSLEKLTSHWPTGGEDIPKPSVVAITGPALEKLTQ